MEFDPVVPVEIQHHIITLVQNPKDILSCAFICKNWLNASRALTFATQVWHVFTWADPDGQKLISLLQHPLSTLKTFLSRLHIRIPFRRHPDQNGHEVMAGLIAHAPHLQELHLISQLTTSTSAEALPRLLELITAASPSLRRFKIVANVGHGGVVQPLVHALSLASSLTDLTVLATTRKKMPVFVAPLPSRPPSLRSMKTRCTDAVFLEEWGLLASQLDIMVNDQTDSLWVDSSDSAYSHYCRQPILEDFPKCVALVTCSPDRFTITEEPV